MSSEEDEGNARAGRRSGQGQWEKTSNEAWKGYRQSNVGNSKHNSLLVLCLFNTHKHGL